MDAITKKSLKRLSQIYYLIWAGLSAIAIVYLGNLYFNGGHSNMELSDLEISGADEFALSQTEPDQDRKQAQFGTTAQKRFATGKKPRPVELKSTEGSWSMQNDIANLRREMSELGSRVGKIEKTGSTIIKKVTGLEQSLTMTTAALSSRAQFVDAGEITGSIRRPKSDPRRGPDGRLRAGAPKYWPIVRVKYLPLPTMGFGDGAARNPDLDTDELAEEPTQTLFGLYLGSGRSLNEVRSHWARMTKDHGKLLGSLEGRYVRKPTRHGRPYQLIAGPFTNAAESLKTCMRLRAKSSSCKQTRFNGKPLSTEPDLASKK